MFLEPRFGAGAGAGAGGGSSCWCAVIQNSDNISDIENDTYLYFTLHCGKK